MRKFSLFAMTGVLVVAQAAQADLGDFLGQIFGRDRRSVPQDEMNGWDRSNGGRAIITMAPESQSDVGAWIVKKKEWTPADEDGFGMFVQSIALSGCTTVPDCMRGPGNPYRASDPPNANFNSDCMDFPYFLRAYYAWKNNLPFSYVSRFRVRDFEDPTIQAEIKAKMAADPTYKYDIRYSRLGNLPSGRHLVAPRTDTQPVNFFTEMPRMFDQVSSGTIRNPMDWAPTSGAYVDSDFYPVDITRESIRPGTIAYDVRGHVSMVFMVRNDGRILLIQAGTAKPGKPNPVGRSSFSTEEIPRSRMEQGWGFKRFRPFTLVGVRNNWFTRAIGGSPVFLPNERIADYSLVQHVGTDPRAFAATGKPVYAHQGAALDYETFVRRRLGGGPTDIVEDFRISLMEICSTVRGREQLVEQATQDRVHLQRHPGVLPANIFGGEGIWDALATPSRDVRIKTAFMTTRQRLAASAEGLKRRDGSVTYSGSALRADLLKIFEEQARACTVSYTNSGGRKVRLDLTQVQNRLTAMSFDPYACPERRWGATSADELRTCSDDATKSAWYEATAGLRNSLKKDVYPSDLTLQNVGRAGAAASPVFDLRSDIDRLFR